MINSDIDRVKGNMIPVNNQTGFEEGWLIEYGQHLAGRLHLSLLLLGKYGEDAVGGERGFNGLRDNVVRHDEAPEEAVGGRLDPLLACPTSFHHQDVLGCDHDLHFSVHEV